MLFQTVFVFLLQQKSIFYHVFVFGSQSKIVTSLLKPNGLLPLLPEFILADVKLFDFCGEVLQDVRLHVRVIMAGGQNRILFLLVSFWRQTSHHSKHRFAAIELSPWNLVIIDNLKEFLFIRCLILSKLMGRYSENVTEVLESSSFHSCLEIRKNLKHEPNSSFFLLLVFKNYLH